MTFPRRCLACLAALPVDSAPRRRYCDARCKHRAQSRRRRGLPARDSYDGGQADVLVKHIHRRDRQLAGKARLIGRLRASRDTARAESRAAVAAAAADRRRADRAIEATAADVHQLRAQRARLLEENAQLRVQLTATEDLAQQLQTARTQLVDLAAVKELPAEIWRQWSALAARIARQAATGNHPPLAGLDHEVVTTWQRHKTAATTPARAAAASRPQRRRPAASPAQPKGNQ